ncbi:MAG: secretin and TonB N-terminal domain-containing protein [Planctomycetota bacterium]
MDLLRQAERIARVSVAAGVVLVICATGPAEPVVTQPAPVENGEKLVSTTRPGVVEELHMRDTDIRRALEMFSRQQRVNIVATQDVKGNVAAVDLYEVTFEEALQAVLRAAGYTYYRENGTIYVCTPKELAERIQATRELAVRTFRLYYATASDARTLVEPALSDDGQVVITPAANVGIAESSVDAGGNSYACEDVLVVRDYPEKIEQIAEIIADLDARPQQVLVEATILRATLSEDNALGVDFNALAGVDFETLNSTSDGLQSVTTGQLDSAGLNRNRATFRTDFNSAIDPGGMTIGFVSNNIGFFVRALESVTDTTVLANPKLLIINKQRGEVLVGSRDGYITTTVTETTATQSVEFLETGTRLVVRPYIGRDGYIRMELHPEDSSGSVQQIGQSVLPSETTTEVTSNVLVRDGHTIVIGGLFRERQDRGRTQVPLVGNVPHLGTLFRTTSDSIQREEVIILITPHIVEHATDEAVSEQIGDDMKRFRLGVRKGMHWWGRGRLAQSAMRKAREKLAGGQRASAMWYLDTALSLQPRMIEGIRMKERLTRQAYWAEQSQYSSVRSVIQRMIMEDLGVPPSRVIGRRKPLDPEDKLSRKVREALGIAAGHQDPIPEAYRPVPLTDMLGGDAAMPDAQDADEPTATTPPAGEGAGAPPAKDTRGGQ